MTIFAANSVKYPTMKAPVHLKETLQYVEVIALLCLSALWLLMKNGNKKS